jgi:hypothetical protein
MTTKARGLQLLAPTRQWQRRRSPSSLSSTCPVDWPRSEHLRSSKYGLPFPSHSFILSLSLFWSPFFLPRCFLPL